MTYAYWKAGRHLEYAVFDMFFRKSPFEGEFTIFAGLDEAIKLVQTFRFTPEHVAYLKTLLPACEPEFWGERVARRACDTSGRGLRVPCGSAVAAVSVRLRPHHCTMRQACLLCIHTHTRTHAPQSTWRPWTAPR